MLAKAASLQQIVIVMEVGLLALSELEFISAVQHFLHIRGINPAPLWNDQLPYSFL